MPNNPETTLINPNLPMKAGKLPLFPASWYLFGESRAIARGPVVKNMLGRDIVAFRTKTGRVVVMDARCSHFGANLGNGAVVGETLQCPYHGWRYGPDGRCESIPSGCPIPDFARQRIFPVEERHGYIFVFNGTTPAFPLPWFLDVAPEGFHASRSFEFTAQSPWPSVTGHPFDLQHFLFVHDRRLIEPPVIDTPLPYVRRIRYRAEIVPRSWRDAVISRLGGRTVSASLVVWGGTFTTITARFDKFTSHFMMTMRPLGRQETLCQGIVFSDSLGTVGLEVRRYFTQAYLVEESRYLGRPASAPDRFVESDGLLRDYFQFLEGMPEAKGEVL